MGNISILHKIIENAETRIARRQDDLTQSAAAVAAIVGPLGASHRLAELAIEFADLAKMTEAVRNG